MYTKALFRTNQFNMRVEKRNHLKIKINQNFNCTLNQKTPKPKEPTMPHRASEAHIYRLTK